MNPDLRITAQKALDTLPYFTTESPKEHQPDLSILTKGEEYHEWTSKKYPSRRFAR